MNFGIVDNWLEKGRSAAKSHILFLLVGLNLIQELANAIATRRICLVKAARINRKLTVFRPSADNGCPSFVNSCLF
jgi:hypothetical protein